MPKAQVNDISMWYEVEGEGEPLFQVHGSVIGHQNFALVTPHLVQHLQVVNFDLRGFGETDQPIQTYTMDTWAADIAVLIDELGYDSVHIHGTSMGSAICMALAASYPDKVRSVILDCPVAKYDLAAEMNKGVWKAIVKAYGWTDTIWDLAAIQSFSRPYLESDAAAEGIALMKSALIAEVPAELFLAISRAMETADMRDLLPTIEAPTLVMIGEKDILSPLDMGPSGAGARYVHESIPNSTLSVMPGCGHVNLYEQPKESAEIIAAFVKKVAGTRQGATIGGTQTQ